MKEFIDIEKIQRLFLHVSSVQLTDLDSKVQAALIAACASIVVSILSALFSSRQTQKSQDRSRAAQMELEKFKLDLTSQYKSVEEQRKSILEFIESIQGLRDDIRKIVQDDFKSLDTQTARQRISSSSDKLVECYQKNQEYLESERVLIHDAKNEAMYLSNTINILFKEKSFASELSQDEKDKLEKFRQNLAECQDRLRDRLISIVPQQVV